MPQAGGAPLVKQWPYQKASGGSLCLDRGTQVGTGTCSRENSDAPSYFYPRFREVAGSLEAALTDVLEDAPGNLKVTNDGLRLSELIRLSIF